MNIVFRVDSSVEIGSGHVMRCLTLAKKLVKQNHSVEFICRKMNGSMEGIIQAENFKVKLLDEVSESLWAWTTKNWAIDARQTIQEIAGEQVDLIIIDHYSIDEKWENELRNYTKKIMVIDDLANRKHSCEILLDQNYYLDMEERYKKLVSSKTITCLGPSFSLLRDEFFLEYSKAKTPTIFVFFGSVDATNETFKTINALKELKSTYKFNTIIVTGNANPQRKEIEKICSVLNDFEYYNQVNNMAELMARCTFSITAGGTITWERAMLSLPGIIISVANNQIELSEALNKKNAVEYLGHYSKVKQIDIEKTVGKIFDEPLVLQNLTNNMATIFNRTVVKKNRLIDTIEGCL